MRSESTSDFQVDVEGVGGFVFGKRTMRDQLLIGAEFSRLSDGVENPSGWLSAIGGAIAALNVLTVKAPAGWSIDAMDPLDDDTYANILKVHAALRAKEDSFRPKSPASSPPAGA